MRRKRAYYNFYSLLVWMSAFSAGGAVFLSLAKRLGVRWALAFCLAFVVIAVLLWLLCRQRNAHALKVAELEKLVRTDDLTGLSNDRSFRQAFAHRNPGLILFDIDQFKPYNDHHGHPAGDEVLRQLGQILQGEPTVYRLGGDEFAVIVGDYDERVSAELAEFLWLKIRNHHWPLRPITASFGVATLPAVFAPELLHSRADQALYQAKREGGDRICVYSEPATD